MPMMTKQMPTTMLTIMIKTIELEATLEYFAGCSIKPHINAEKAERCKVYPGNLNIYLVASCCLRMP
jgi:hypothetical protein